MTTKFHIGEIVKTYSGKITTVKEIRIRKDEDGLREENKVELDGEWIESIELDKY